METQQETRNLQHQVSLCSTKGRILIMNQFYSNMLFCLFQHSNPTFFTDPVDAQVATKDRLMQLIIKGILYESCVDFCQQKATGGPPKASMNGSHTSSLQNIKFTNVLNPSDFSDSDLSLLSWLQVM